MKVPRINMRSLRVRLCLWYVLLSMISMSALGTFSYVYLAHALASSRQVTMERREMRLVRFLETERQISPNIQLQDQLRHFMEANPDTDVLEVQSLEGVPIYPDARKAPSFAWSDRGCTSPCFRLQKLGDHQYRMLQQSVSIQGRRYHVTIAGIIDEHYDILRIVESSFFIFLPLMFFASIAGGFMLSHRALEPVDRITRAAHWISLRDLNHRLPVPLTGDELQRLAETWNDLLERLEVAVKSLRQFTSDISHDLRTSITVMLSESQLALRRERSKEEYRESIETILSECQSTATLLDDLLAASRSGVPEQKIEWVAIDLVALVTESCNHLQARSEMKSQRLEVKADSAVWIGGDASLLRRLVNILLDNALKYTGEGGTITACVTRNQQHVSLQIADTGVGIAPEEVPKIFNRFYRTDTSRNRDQGGNGLGLAIAKWIAEVHRSTIAVAPNIRGGSVFSASFDLWIDEAERIALEPKSESLLPVSAS
jgi:two-component system, OmpR family, heavy metal sensor histidine kinase CusS